MYRKTLEQKLFSKILKDEKTGCWIFQGSKAGNGYGVICFGRANRIYAHRFMFEFTKHVKLESSDVICHTCDTPACLNPLHLFKGKTKDNVLDCLSKGRNRNGKENQTQCKNGHELSGDNLKIESTGFRRCVKCRKLYLKTWSENRSLNQVKKKLAYSRWYEKNKRVRKKNGINTNQSK